MINNFKLIKLIMKLNKKIIHWVFNTKKFII